MHCTGTHAPEVEDLHMACMKFILMSHSELEYERYSIGNEVKVHPKEIACNVMNLAI